MKVIVPRTWFLSLCSTVAVGLKMSTPETKTSFIDGQDENETEQKCELRIVLVGKTGVGKSATGNTILGKKVFNSTFSPTSVTRQCKKEFGIIHGRKISIIDTPGLFDTNISKEQIEKEIKTCMSYSAPGPHAFLVVIKLERFTEENAKAIEYIKRLFGEKGLDYTMALFTHADQLDGQDIKTFVRSSPELLNVVKNYGNRYFGIDNKKQDSAQVMQLLDKIDEMVSDNGGVNYTNEMLQEAEKAIEEEKLRILKENEEQRKREQQKLEQRYQGEREKLEKMQKELEQQQMEMARRQAEKNNGFIQSVVKLIKDVVTLFTR